MAGATYLLVLVNIAAAMSGVGGQEIKFENVERVSPCNEGLRAGTDNYLITATVGPNVTALTEQYWESFVQFGVSTRTSNFTEICSIFIGRTGAFCVSASTDPCYCDQFNTTTGLAHVVVRYTTVLAHSQDTLLYRWRNNKGSEVYSVQYIILPVIYDVNIAVLELTVNGHPAVGNACSCGSSFTPGVQNTLKLCCTKTASPCYPRIAFDGKIIAENQPECVNYKFTPPSDNFTVIITKSYSVCSLSDYITAGSCTKNTSVGSPTLTPSTTSSSTDTDSIRMTTIVSSSVTETTTGTVGQEIKFKFQRMSPCSDGLRAGADTYLINGTVGNVTALVASGWEYSVHFGVFTRTSQFVELCQINIGRTGIFCQPPYTPPCYCNQFDAATGVGHIFVNYTARLVDSQQNLIFQWQHANGTNVYSAQNISLPAIYDVSNADLKLTVNGDPVNVENGGSYGSSFTAGQENTLKLCCSNTAKPCYPRIDFDGFIVADNQPECVNYTFTPLSGSFTVTITKLYSVCTQSDYITAGSCTINTSLATTTTSSRTETGTYFFSSITPVL